jgi:hypothetical protein
MPLRAIQRIPKNQKDGTHTPTSQRREGSEERGSPSLTRSHAPTLGQGCRERERVFCNSESSKHLRFFSFQTHQKMYIGTIFQITTLIGLPDFHQQENKSITLLGITHDVPKQVKMLFHKTEATSQ